ncbi:sugar ABC transporter ATP-binding protein [Mesorhizobium sp.]|uniref:sugar ABC transporter ATP-binding protein n=1 Tax=Mesorhizobium sp. TaxID=1871066 RepID=UPI0025C24F82|nr:sugar ABC transporter ATP-binding protein [Mesorhizobium sp.]
MTGFHRGTSAQQRSNDVTTALHASPAETAPLLTVRRLSKSFSGQKILDDLSFEVLPGEIHALVGENGCGKSTFIKCLAGFHQPDEGAEIEVMGRVLSLPYSPSDAGSFGFSFIHQNLGLVPTQSVAENLALSRGFRKSFGWRIRWRDERERAHQALAGFGEHIDPDTLVADLPQADRTLVAIARGMQRSEGHPGIFILDEPTAALPADQVQHLFEMLREIAAKGVGIVYVSHRLNEILELCDRVTALRDGRRVATRPVAGLSERELVELIIGRSLDSYYPQVDRVPESERLLEVKGLVGNRVRSVDLAIRRGEIVGIAGLLGSGRSELGRLLFGAQQRRSGTVSLGGEMLALGCPSDGLRSRIGYVPQDRLGQGGVGRMTVAENLLLPDMGSVWNGLGISARKEREIADDVIRRFNIRPPYSDATFSTLSGGNQQKAILARALRLAPKLLILDEPTQGIDIGSKAEIYEIIANATKSGMALLLVDSDFEDLCRLCDRVLVMTEGTIVAELAGATKTANRISEIVYLSKESLQ